ncbi:hypothetical protein QBC46DRAFT_359621 [Diplogelasinospora grovesii]|uniref:Uncharacterized protein n=1 Tax=Diplogelasinospora grovesii TaxID=303347 RepID=A0AAN6MWC9_9PEZI|nr:hypothetical protein QBC46DRAFT_359621 [Diplogelasinospora grovesii]
MDSYSQRSHSRSPSPDAGSWQAVRGTPTGKAFQQVFALDWEARRQPWEQYIKINEKESANIVGDDMRLLGGRVNAHSS